MKNDNKENKVLSQGAKWQEQNSDKKYSIEDLEKAYDLGIKQMESRGVYVRAWEDWDEIKEQFKKK